MKPVLGTVLFALGIIVLAIPANAGPYEDGIEATQQGDYATALQLWRPLAEQGHALVQSHLGYMYENGKGVPQNDAKAVKWYRKAAEQGYIYAQFNLGVMYANGQGVQRDYVVAHMWFILAATSGHEEARRLLSGQEEDLTPDQVAEAHRMAREWMEKHQQ